MAHVIFGQTAYYVPADSPMIAVFNCKVKVFVPTPNVVYYGLDNTEVNPGKQIVVSNEYHASFILTQLSKDKDVTLRVLVDAIINMPVRDITTSVNTLIWNNIRAAVPCDISMWYMMSTMPDYDRHRHLGSNWTVTPKNDEIWIKKATKYGVSMSNLLYHINGIYPGEVANIAGDAAAAAAAAPAANTEEKEKRYVEHLDYVGDQYVQQIREFNQKKAEEKKEINAAGVHRNLVINRIERKLITSKQHKLKEKTNYGMFDAAHVPINSITSDQVVKWYKAYMKVGKPDSALLMVARIMVSNKTTHLAIKNPELMTLVGQQFDAHPKVAKLFAERIYIYASRAMYLHNVVCGKTIAPNNMSVFTEEQVAALPVFNMMVHKNPYFPVIPSDSSPLKQVPLNVHGKRPRRITTIDEFTRRIRHMTMYMGNKQGVPCLIDAIDFTVARRKADVKSGVAFKSKVYISGGLVAGCSSHTPLEYQYPTPLAFLEDKYGSYATIDTDLFYSIAHSLADEHKVELDNKWNRDEIMAKLKDAVPETKYIILTKLNTDINTQVFGDKTLGVRGVSDLDVSFHSHDHDAYDQFVDHVWKCLIKAGYERIWRKRVPRAFGSYKIIICGPDMPRPIDIFRTNTTPVRLIVKYHLAAVRLLFDPANMTRVWLYSAVMCHMTGVSPDLHWVSNNKDPMLLLISYIRRGFTLYMNRRMLKPFEKCVINCPEFAEAQKSCRGLTIGAVSPKHAAFITHSKTGKKMKPNNSRLPWSKIDNPWYRNDKIIMPDVNAFPELIAKALAN